MSYDAKSIQLRDFRTACRETPGMYLGDDKQGGIFNCFMEILNNSCDEAIMGRGNEINVMINKDSITVTDYGAGIPRGETEDSQEILIDLFTKSHSSGKFNNDNYKKVRGLHGVGSSAVCVCSSFFKVTTRRDKGIWSLEFKDGIPQSEKAILVKKLKPTDKTGTSITFTPDPKIFHIEDGEELFDVERIRQELLLTSYFIPKVKFTLEVDGIDGVETFYSANGMKDFAKSMTKNALHKNFIYGYKEFEDEVEIEVFAQWTTGKEKSYVFSNGALNAAGGTPISGAKASFTRTINSLGKTDFDGDTIRKGLVYIINIKHPHPIYQNQIKDKIQNQELRGYTQTVFTEAIKEFANKNREEFKTLINVLKKEQRAEHAAEKARESVLQAANEVANAQKKKAINLNKLKDAEFLGEDSILLLVEGDSAGGAMAQARDEKKYGILKLRGKLINGLSNQEEDVFNNEEIKLFLSAMNIVPGKYNSSKLRYGRVGICVDADSDGFHIGLLIMAMLAKIAPDFLKEGRLCWLRTPLYKVTQGKKETFFFTEQDYFAVRDTVKGEVKRMKGLGALNPEEAKKSMFGELQQLDTFKVTDNDIDLLSSLMGSDSSYRTEFVMNNIDFSEIRE